MRRSLIAIAAAAALGGAPATVRADPGTIAFILTSAVEIAGFEIAVSTLLTIGATVYGSASARRKARKQAARARAEYNSSLEDRSVTTLTATPPWQVVYGRCTVGGAVVAIFTSDKTGTREDGSSYTKPDAYKHLVIEIAHTQCHAINEVHIEGEAVGALDGSGWATTGPFVSTRTDSRTTTISGSSYVDVPDPVVSILNAYKDLGGGDIVDVTPTLSNGNTRITNPDPLPITVDYTVTATRSAVRISKHLGTSSQTVDTYLNSVKPTEWTANHRLRGATYAVVTLDLEDQRFQAGPPNITFDVSGKLLYDPRTGLTAWSDNPALVIRDWLTSPWGYGCASADVDDTYTIAAANACDVSISLTVDASTTTGPTYTCNGAFTTDDSREAVLEDLCECMAGFAVYGAQWQIIAGAWTASVMDLTDDDLDGQIELVQAGAPSDEIFNGVRGTYIPSGKSTPTDFKPPYQNSTFVAADGEELWSDVALLFTDNPARCRNLARIITERARSGEVIRYPAKLKAWPLQVGDRVRVTSGEYGFSAKYFRVTDWQFGVQAPVLLTLQEDAEDIYDLADAAQSDPTPNTDLPDPFTVSAITGLAAVSVGEGYTDGDGTFVPRVRVTWNAVSDPYVVDGSGRIVLLWRRPGSTTSWQQQNAPADATKDYITGVRAGDRLVIEAYVVNGLGKVGPSAFVAHTVSGKTSAPANVSGLTAAVVQGGVKVSWSASAEDDNAYTEIRHGAVSWATATTIFKGKADNFVWLSPSAGSYTLRAKHFDTSGNESATNATHSVSFTANDLRDAAAVNFDARNDRIATAVVAPTIASDGTAIDHALNTDGSADISFEWSWGGTEAQIDGFQVMVRTSSSSSAYTAGTAVSEEMIIALPANKRAMFLYGVNPTSYHTFAIRAFRVVDPDVDASGLLTSAWVQPAAAGEAPYRPSSNAAFAGDVTGSVNGIAAGNVNAWAHISGISVTTGQIAANAATDTFQATDAGPYTTIASDKAPVSFTPSVTCDVIVTVECNFACTNSGGASAFMKGSFGIYQDSTSLHATRYIAQTIGAGLSHEFPLTATYRFSGVPAGVPVQFACRYSDHGSSALSGTVTDLRTKVEVIKR